MLAMDSGNAHIAAMYGIQVVTIWGVTHPYAGFTAFNTPLKNHLVPDRTIYPKIPTSIYGNKYPLNYKNAAGNIEVKTIVNTINTIVNN